MPPDMQALNQLTFGNDQRGGMAALDFGGEKLSMDSFRKRVEAFVKSGDVNDLAKLRYVYFEGNGKGGTRFLTVWSDEHLQLDKLAPKNGQDAPGADLQDVPRYPGTTRVLSAEERGMPRRAWSRGAGLAGDGRAVLSRADGVAGVALGRHVLAAGGEAGQELAPLRQRQRP